MQDPVLASSIQHYSVWVNILCSYVQTGELADFNKDLGMKVPCTKVKLGFYFYIHFKMVIVVVDFFKIYKGNSHT